MNKTPDGSAPLKIRQWAPTELPRMRQELVLAAEEAAERAVNDLKVTARIYDEENKFADHVAQNDPAMARQIGSSVQYRAQAVADLERRQALQFQAAELSWVTPR